MTGKPISSEAALLPFHLAVRVDELQAARRFYGELLGCAEGRSAPGWIDFNFFGHQLVCHLAEPVTTAAGGNAVDGHEVPVPHFGVVLGLAEWQALHDRLRAAGVAFLVPPHVRFAGQAGEQRTLFVADPAGNALEFKGLADHSQLFARE